MPPAIQICDVAPRDGLQNESVRLAPAARAELARRIATAGVPRIEAASFVNERLVPQMAGAEAVIAALSGAEAGFCGLVLNRRGLDRALGCGLTDINYAYPVTDGFARANQNTTAAAAADAATGIIDAAHAASARITIILSCAFGCPLEGRVDPGRVVDHATRAYEAGADAVVLADTIGVGTPAQAGRLVADTMRVAARRPVGLHLHNTRNTGYANAVAGLSAGATLLDAALGGIGGCPFAPRATGNIATEDLVYLLETDGVDTGIDLDRLLEGAAWLVDALGHELPGLVHRAGPFPGPAPSLPEPAGAKLE